MSDYRNIMERISSVRDVVASTPFVLSQVMLSSASNVSGVVLHGIDIPTAPDVINIKETIVEGELKLLEGDVDNGEGSKLPGIVIGKELSRILGVYPGNHVTVISPTGLLSPAGMVPRWKKFLVVGIFWAPEYFFSHSLGAGLQAHIQEYDISSFKGGEHLAQKIRVIYNPVRKGVVHAEAQR